MEQLNFKLKNLKVKQGTFEINNINEELKRGDILGITGRSGSGKSTFIKSLIGQVKIISGEIEIVNTTKKNEILKYIGYSPQENSLYSYLTLQENIFLFGQLYNLEREVIEKRMTLLLTKLDLQNEKNKRITQMSGGMKKRADLAVSLIHDPEIILLDEPFNGLDVSLQKFIWDFLKGLANEGKIIMISSHILKDITKNCNKFALIENGNFYNTEQLITVLKRNKNIVLEEFLQKLFDKDLKK